MAIKNGKFPRKFIDYVNRSSERRLSNVQKRKFIVEDYLVYKGIRKRIKTFSLISITYRAIYMKKITNFPIQNFRNTRFSKHKESS